MYGFALLTILLIVFVTISITIPLTNRKMKRDEFVFLCEKKIKRLTKKSKLLSVEDLNIVNFSNEQIMVNQVIFGKKYIYLISDIFLKGFVKGEVNDNSWIYFDKIHKRSNYIANLKELTDKNKRDFADILGIKPDPIVSICLVPNDCDFKVKNLNDYGTYVVHHYSLKRKLRKLERQEIGSLNEKEIYEQYQTIKAKNSEGK